MAYFIRDDWDEWKGVDHDDFKQIERIKRAFKEKFVLKDCGNGVFRIAGSGKDDYTVTSSSCTCPDYMNRFPRTPCKHIYAVAKRLGYITSDGIEERNSPEVLTIIADDLLKYKNLYSEGSLSSDAYIAMCKALEKSLKL